MFDATVGVKDEVSFEEVEVLNMKLLSEKDFFPSLHTHQVLVNDILHDFHRHCKRERQEYSAEMDKITSLLHHFHVRTGQLPPSNAIRPFSKPSWSGWRSLRSPIYATTAVNTTILLTSSVFWQRTDDEKASTTPCKSRILAFSEFLLLLLFLLAGRYANYTTL